MKKKNCCLYCALSLTKIKNNQIQYFLRVLKVLILGSISKWRKLN